MSVRWIGLTFACALVAPACMVHKVQKDRQAPVTMPAKFSDGGAGNLPDRWWKSFSDPQLDAFVDELLRKNLDIKQGWARVKQAVALARKAGAALYPWIQAELGASYGQSSFYGGDQFGDQSLASGRLPIGLAVSYEVDLWGRVASLRNAARLDVKATREDLSAMAMSLVGSTTDLWFSIREIHAQKALVKSQIKVNRTYLELVELRFANGLASALEVLQQKQQVLAGQAQLPLLEASARVAHHQLDVLVGRAPGTSGRTLTAGLPTCPPIPSVGAPAKLLNRRPDVRSARLRMLGADHRVGVAVAERFPALRLGASGGVNGNSVSSMFTTWVYSLVSNLVAPLFQGGRLSAEVARTRAALEERVQAYGKVLLTAFREVQDALIRERKQREHLKVVEAQITTARNALSHARDRYLRGQVNYLVVLTSLQTVQTIERNRLTAQRQLLSYRIGLYRALGGSWTRTLRPEPRPVKKRVAGKKKGGGR